MKPIHSPLPATVAPSLPTATTPCRPCQQLALPTSNTSNYHLRTSLMPPGAIPQLLMTTWGQSRVDSMASAGSSLWEHWLCATPCPSKHTIAKARQAEQPVHLPALLNAACEDLPSPTQFLSSHTTTWPPEEPICKRFTLLFQFFSAPEAQKGVVGWQLSRYHTAALNPSLLQQQANTDQIT